MPRASRVLPALLLAATLPGCMRGWIYTEVVTPLTLDAHGTPRGSRMVELGTKHLHEPITAAQVGVDWRSRAIGEAARTLGLERVYFADLRTLSVLGGVYREETVLVWGD